MHTLRYVMGDELFFPALKKLATDSRYTYHNLVTTDDVERFFSQQYGASLKRLFDFYLRTTQKLEIGVTKTGDINYKIKLLNYDGILPLDITTSTGTKRINISRQGDTVSSVTHPFVDQKGFYLKRVIYE